MIGELKTMDVGLAATHLAVGVAGRGCMVQGARLDAAFAHGSAASGFFRHYSGFSGSPVVAY